jgi:small subunit ribosomal protein S8
VKHAKFEEWEKKFLPSREVGLLVVSTPNGVLSHRDAIDKQIGGKLLAFIY